MPQRRFLRSARSVRFSAAPGKLAFLPNEQHGRRLTLNYGSRMRPTFMLSPEDREIRLGIWKIHILHHAAARDVWGKWLLDELAEHGHLLSLGTLYAALLRMATNVSSPAALLPQRPEGVPPRRPQTRVMRKPR